MKRSALIACLVLQTLLCAAQQTDAARLTLEADFSGHIVTEQAPAGANAAERAAWAVRRQLAGKDRFDPPNYMFFRQAAKSIGFFPAIFATADRILRDTRIGTVRERFDEYRSSIEEGPEAYQLPDAKR